MARKSDPKCGAKTRTTGKPCTNVAGKGTDHKGVGKCLYHGGLSPGAEEGNKYALVTGEYETIYFSTLNDGEKNLWDLVEVKPLPQVTDELKLTTVRIHRMLLRINDVRKAALQHETNALEEGRAWDGMVPVSRTYTGGFQAQGQVNFTVKEYETPDTQIMRIEEALDRMQKLKIAQIRQLDATLKANPEESEGLEGLLHIIDVSAKTIAEAQHAREADG